MTQGYSRERPFRADAPMPNPAPAPSPARAERHAAVPWDLAGQLQSIAVRVSGDHSTIRDRAEEFLSSLVGKVEPASRRALEFDLRLLDHASDRPIPFGSKALIQFYSISCFQDGCRFAFCTKDGSFIEADVPAGRAWGGLTTELTSRRHRFIELVMAPLMEMLKHRGFYGLHAAAVTMGDTGYLFPGGTGSGKTTTALGLIKQGFRYLADDKVLLTEEGTEIAALAFTRRFNIEPDISRQYPELAFLADLEPISGCLKRAIDVSTVYPQAFAPRCRPRFLIHLEITPDAGSRIIRLSRTESFARLVQQTILSSEKAVAAKQLALFGKLVQRTESYLLSGSSDIYGVPERLGKLLPGT